jgi:hypothetical protein
MWDLYMRGGRLVGNYISCATISLSRRTVRHGRWTHPRSLQIRSRGFARDCCCVRRNVSTESKTRSDHPPPRLHTVCLLHLFYMCFLMAKFIGLLCSPKTIEFFPPTKRVDTSELSAEQLVVFCYWLALYAETFLIGCRFWTCFSIHVGRWYGILAAGCQVAAQCRPVSCGERQLCCGTRWHRSAATSVEAAPGNVSTSSHLGPQIMPSFVRVVPQLFPVNTGKVSRSGRPMHESSFILLSRHSLELLIPWYINGVNK